MKAVSCVHGTLEVVDLPEPQPAGGQLVLDVLRCGICGSDLHAKDHADDLTEVMAEGGYSDFMRSDTPVVMGHEFCGVVAERGRKVGKEFTPGTTVVSFPLAARARRCAPHRPVPDGAGRLRRAGAGRGGDDVRRSQRPGSRDVAALTEPMAVAYHAVRRSEISRKDVAIVLGCGPVGLAVICHLKARGVRHHRRQRLLRRHDGRWPRRCGADVVVDPAVDSPYEAVPAKQRALTTAARALRTRRRVDGEAAQGCRDGRTSTGRPTRSAPPSQAAGDLRMRWRAGDDRRNHRRGAAGSRIVVVGVCMGRRQPAARDGDRQRDRPALRIRLHAFGIPRHPVHARPTASWTRRALVTGTVGLDGVARRSTRSAIPRSTPRSSSTPPVRPSRSGSRLGATPRFGHSWRCECRWRIARLAASGSSWGRGLPSSTTRVGSEVPSRAGPATPLLTLTFFRQSVVGTDLPDKNSHYENDGEEIRMTAGAAVEEVGESRSEGGRGGSCGGGWRS